jgi:tetratricopeptide (TPR) repeat protein
MRVLGSRVIFRLIMALLLAFGAAAPAVAVDLDQAERQELEALLARLGFQPGPLDGVVDERTRAAILRYQAFAALTGPGEPSLALLIELRAVEQALAAMREATLPAGAAALGSAVVSEDSDRAAEPAEATEAAALEEVPEAAPVVRSDPSAPAAAEASPGPPPEAGEQLFPEKLDAPTEAEAEEDGNAEVDEVLVLLTPYKKALDSGELAPGELARTFNEQGQADFESALYDRAVAEFGAAIRLDPEFAAAFHNRGAAHEAAGRRDLAARDFERAFELGFGRLKLGGSAE